MAGERALPGLGLTGFWTAGTDGWGGQMDTNLLKLSVLANGSVLSKVTALPGAPTNGDIYIVPSGAGSNPNKVAVRDNGAWVYLVPNEGWRFWLCDTNVTTIWDGGAWV